MPVYYRLIENIHRETPLGFGPYAGRWNARGIPCIYLSSHTSLCFLEYLSIKGPVVSEKEWLLLRIDIQNTDQHLGLESLPSDWQTRPYPSSTNNLGSSWLISKTSSSLKVPSIRIPLINYPAEHNLLLNPLHPDFKKDAELIGVEEIEFKVIP